MKNVMIGLLLPEKNAFFSRVYQEIGKINLCTLTAVSVIKL